MLLFAVRPDAFIKVARSPNWGIWSAARMSQKNTCAVTSTLAPALRRPTGWLMEKCAGLHTPGRGVFPVWRGRRGRAGQDGGHDDWGPVAGQLDLFGDAATDSVPEPVLMALHAEYYDLIWQGRKTHECKRRFLEGRAVRWFVYLNAPVSRLAAVIDLGPALALRRSAARRRSRRSRSGCGRGTGRACWSTSATCTGRSRSRSSA